MNFFDMLVSKSINGGGGGSGTSNYNELSNKPSINNVTLTGNKTASALGLQPEITGDVKISSDNVDDTGATNLFVTSDEKSTWSGKQDALTFDDAPTENSNNPVKSGGIYTALSGKQATLTFDDSPTSGSSNPVKSGGVYTALGNKQDTVTFDGTYSASTNKAATVSTVTNAVNALDVTGGSVAASKTLASWSETNGKVSVTTQDIAITGSQAVLTGYSIAQSKQSIAATDTATEAFGKVEQRVQTNENNISSNKINIISLSCGTDNISILGSYANGGLNTDGTLNPSQQFRVSSTDIISFPNYEVVLILPPAFKIGYIPFINGVAGDWSGWYNGRINIPANTVLKFQIARVNENHSEIADIGTFTDVKIVHLSSINDISFGNGSIDSSGYENYTIWFTRLMSTYVDVRSVNDLIISINKNYKYGWHTYDENFIPIENATAFTSDNLHIDVSNASYMRFNFGKITDEDISPTDAASMDFKIANPSQFSDSALSYSYTGCINIRKTYTNKIYATYTPATALPTTTPQGMSIHNGLAFLLYDKGGLAIFDLIRKVSVAEMSLASASADNHCNSANFSTEFASGGVYPLLYISECYGQHRCFVENITNSSSTLVQTINFANENGDYTNSTYNNAFDWILDNDTGMLMTYGLMSDGKHKIKMFAKPNTSNATVTLHETDVVEEWIVEDNIYPALSSNYVYQGNCAKGGIIYLLAYQSNEIICVDENTHEMTARVPLTFNTSGEPEDLAIYAGTMFVVYGDKKIYGMSFD